MKRLIVSICVLSVASSLFAQQNKPNLPWVDISDRKDLQTVIAKGQEDLYNGHPTTAMLDDNKTIFCTWSTGHGGPASFMAKSLDAGVTWNTTRTPSDWQQMGNCPSIYRLTDKKGKERLFVFCGYPQMGQSYSEDGGKSWSTVKSLNKPCVMAFSSIVKLKNGDYLGLYHRGFNDQDKAPLTLWQAISHDGGLTWDESTKVGEMEGRSPCEPFAFRSPDGNRLICIARENDRIGNSLMMISNDEGKSWSPLKETAWGLTGDRHIIKYTTDGRIIAVFRDMAPNSPTKGHFVAWIGNYNDLTYECSGQYRIKLLHSYAGGDCGYPGLEILPDGTIIAITYIKYKPGKKKHSIVEVKFKLSETDKLL